MIHRAVQASLEVRASAFSVCFLVWQARAKQLAPQTFKRRFCNARNQTLEICDGTQLPMFVITSFFHGEAQPVVACLEAVGVQVGLEKSRLASQLPIAPCKYDAAGLTVSACTYVAKTNSWTQVPQAVRAYLQVWA